MKIKKTLVSCGVLVGLIGMASCGKTESESANMGSVNQFAAFMTSENGMPLSDSLSVKEESGSLATVSFNNFFVTNTNTTYNCSNTASQVNNNLFFSIDTNGSFLLYKDDSSFYGNSLEDDQRSIYGIPGQWSVESDIINFGGALKSFPPQVELDLRKTNSRFNEADNDRCLILKAQMDLNFQHVSGPSLNSIYGSSASIAKDTCIEICNQ